MNDGYVSTGRLPTPETVQALVEEAHARFASNDEGQNAQHYPALARVPRGLFGICVVGVSGRVFRAGDTGHQLTIMSVAKPFTFAPVLQAIGAQEARAKLGLNATGLQFNSVMAVELHSQRLTNPMVNSGALATVGLVPGATAEARWRFIQEGLSRFAGRSLALDQEVYASASASNVRNQGLARILAGHGRLYGDPEEVTDVFTRQSSLSVTAQDLAVMAATLADGGVNPVTREQVVDAALRPVLAGRDTPLILA
ncbi:MAG TPA: glutaminase, partial [Chloroflexota bacterium]|nr:glutaminase [Chloroflexota bacterium]